VQSLPGLSAWFLARAEAALHTWHNRVRREALAKQLASAAAAGHLTAMLTVLEDANERVADEREAQQAAYDLRRIDAELAHIANGAAGRSEAASRLGHEIAASVGLTALALASVLAVLS